MAVKREEINEVEYRDLTEQERINLECAVAFDLYANDPDISAESAFKGAERMVAIAKKRGYKKKVEAVGLKWNIEK